MTSIQTVTLGLLERLCDMTVRMALENKLQLSIELHIYQFGDSFSKMLKADACPSELFLFLFSF